MIKLNTPLKEEDLVNLRAGDEVLISGVIYTARDAAHKRMTELIEDGKELPMPIEGQVIYYAGPAPAKPGQVIGSAGPTTSYRVDTYAPAFMDLGLKGMIGKGKRSPEVIESIKKNKAVYFGAVGGAAVLISKSVISAEVIAYEDLGAEAIRKLVVKDMPVFVVNDVLGNDLYEMGKNKYKID